MVVSKRAGRRQRPLLLLKLDLEVLLGHWHTIQAKKMSSQFRHVSAMRSHRLLATSSLAFSRLALGLGRDGD